MTDLLKIADISDDEIERLRQQAGIRSIEGLWTRVDEIGTGRVAFQAGLAAEDLRALLPDRDVPSLPGRPPEPQGSAPRLRIKAPTLDDLWGRLDASGPDTVASETGISRDRLLELTREREAREAAHRQALSSQDVAALPNITLEAVVGLADGGVMRVEDLWNWIRAAGCDGLAQQTGLSAERLYALLQDGEARTVYNRLPDADIPIERFENVTAHEARSFRNAGITTIGQARAQLAESGVERLARESELGQRDLLELFSRQAVREAERGDRSLIARAWLPGLLMVGVLVVLALVFRSTGIFGVFPAPIGGVRAVIVPKFDLAAGTPVRAADFAMAVLPCGAQCFDSVEEFEGFKLARPVRAGKVLRHRDVVRLQVTAARDVPANSRIAPEGVSLMWTPYEPDAIVRADQVAGRNARYAIRAGEVLRAGVVEASRALAPQVAVRRAAGLVAFEVIGPNDVEVRDGPHDVGSFDTAEQVVGRFPLQTIPRGVTIRADDLGSPRIDPAALKGRRLLRAPVITSGLTALIQPGDRVSLRQARTAKPIVVRNAILVAMEPRGEGASVIVAVSAADVARLAAVTGTPSVFAVWPES